MGFAIPVAVGAALTSTRRRVVCVVGDGSFLISASELLTAHRLGLNLLVIIVSDQAFGLIRSQQLREYGHSFLTELPQFELDQLVSGLSGQYFRVQENIELTLTQALNKRGVVVVELEIGENARLQRQAILARAKSSVRGIVPLPFWAALKKAWRSLREGL
jgi:acetolactate synthase-1/2/3 large subunit